MIYLEKYHAISIRQAQRNFYKSRFGYDVARKRLKQLEEMEFLKSYLNFTTNEKVFYLDRKASSHDLYIMDFYSLLVANNCTNIEFIKEPRYLKNMIRPDGFFKFQYNGNIYFILLEVDLTSYTSRDKFQMYEMLFRSGELQEACYGTFPIIVVMTYNREIKYESDNFEVVYMDFNLSDFNTKVLGTV